MFGSDDPCKNCEHHALCRFDEKFDNYKRTPKIEITEKSFSKEEADK